MPCKVFTIEVHGKFFSDTFSEDSLQIPEGAEAVKVGALKI